jgi:hypothetical protein
MKTCLKPWPKGLDRTFRPLAQIAMPRLLPHQWSDLRSLEAARNRRLSAPRMTRMTQTYGEMFYFNRSDFSAMNNQNVETGIIQGGGNAQPTLPSNFFGAPGFAQPFRIEASGIIGTTGTPTIIFQVRLGSTIGVTTYTGASVGVSAAITTQSGISNQWWSLVLDLTCNTPGQGTGNCTLSGAGYVESPGGFASPFKYSLAPGTPPTATWTQTIDGSLTQYFNLSATWSAASGSNTITVKTLRGIMW